MPDDNNQNEQQEVQSDEVRVVEKEAVNAPKSATTLLSQLASEDFSQVKKALSFVEQGYKLNNAAMQELLFDLKTKYDMSYRDLLAIYLTLDIAVEKGALTNEVLDYLREHPDELKIFEE